jgi:hypothetical protein
MSTRTADFTNSKDSEIYFPVSLRDFEVPFSDATGEPVMASAERFKAVVREDTGKVLAVHRSTYNLVHNEEIYPQFEEALRRSKLDLTDMYTSIAVNDDGASVVKSYHFPAHKVAISKGDEVDMVLRVRNSYDGRWAFGTVLGGYRLICSNGMVIGKQFSSSYGKHTRNLNVSTSVDKLNAAIDVYKEHQSMWELWSSKTVTDMAIRQMIDNDLNVPDAFKRELYTLYLNEKSNGIKNLWALFNALTCWSTHGKMACGGQRSVTQDNREKRVREIINSKAWKDLAA